jgi:hypothetical protein
MSSRTEIDGNFGCKSLEYDLRNEATSASDAHRWERLQFFEYECEVERSTASLYLQR